MKRLLFLSLCLLGATLSLQAQRPSFKPQAHQLELQLGTLHSLIPGSDATYSNGNAFASNYLNGFSYTYHYSLAHGFRAGVQRLSADYAIEGGLATQADVWGWEYNLGYVYKYHIKQSQIFFAADLLYNTQKIWETGPTINTIASDAYPAFGGRVGMGYRLFFTPNISLAIEGYGKYLQRSSGQNPVEFEYSFFQANELSWNASATLSLHLVKMKKRCECPKLGKSKYR